MHKESLANMARAFETHLEPAFQGHAGPLYVVDIGAKDVNGSYRELFKDSRFDYLGIDLEPGNGVDLVISDPYQFELPDACADIVISGQQLEHCEFFWKALEEMARILKPGGMLILIVPSTGFIHRFPVDCFRFLPDSMPAFARLINCQLLESWCDEQSEWGDLVGVFKKPGEHDRETIVYTHGGIHYTQFIAEWVAASGSRAHLEIGSANGNSIRHIGCATIAIDPQFRITDSVINAKPMCLFFQMESDAFFEKHNPEVLLQQKLDTAFLDGMHHFEFLLRDFINTERHAHPDSTVFMHDCLPTTVAMTDRDPAAISFTGPTAAWWAGDVWKVVDILKRYRPDLTIQCYDCQPTGLVVVSGLKPGDTTLVDQYEAIVQEYAGRVLSTSELRHFLADCQIQRATTRTQP